MCGILSMMLPSLILLMKANPAPLSVIVSPSASSDLMISISFGRPFLCANIKSSSPICPPRSFDMSTLCEFSVQKRIWKKWIGGKLFVTTWIELICQVKPKKTRGNFFEGHRTISLIDCRSFCQHRICFFFISDLKGHWTFKLFKIFLSQNR